MSQVIFPNVVVAGEDLIELWSFDAWGQVMQTCGNTL